MALLGEGEQLAPRGQEFRALLGAELFARARNLEVALPSFVVQPFNRLSKG